MNFFKKFFKELTRKPLKLAATEEKIRLAAKFTIEKPAATEGKGNFAAKFNV